VPRDLKTKRGQFQHKGQTKLSWRQFRLSHNLVRKCGSVVLVTGAEDPGFKRLVR